MNELMLYPREDGRFGVRNRIAVISTVACANHVAQRIADSCSIADGCTHAYGCDQLGPDLELSRRMLVEVGRHPNNCAVLVVGLGCEEIDAHELAAEIRESGKPARSLVIQETGGTATSTERGAEILREFEQYAGTIQRVPAPVSALTIGIECGGSDYTSGIAANPALGIMSDRLCEQGARVIFGETTELMGAEEIIYRRCRDDATRQRIAEQIASIEDYARSLGVDIRGAQPSPGNIEGGLSTIEEKSLGGICKSGNSTIMQALSFGETPSQQGLSFMHTPGNDLACTLGLVAGGAQIVVFTTGRGTPMGFATAPLIKVTANRSTAERMAENFDLDLSDVIDGDLTLEGAADQLCSLVARVANGEEVATEQLGHREFGLYRISSILL